MNARVGFVGRLALAAVLALACSSDKKTLLLVDVGLQPGVTAPTSLTIDVSAAGVPVGSQDYEWKGATNGIRQIGIYLPEGVAGAVMVTATGKSGGVAQSRASKETNVLADKTNGPVRLLLDILVVVGDGDAGVEPVPSDADAADVARHDGRAFDGGAEDADDDVGPFGLGDGGVDAAQVDAPADDANPAFTDAPVGDGGSAGGDLGSDASGVLGWQPAENVEKDPVTRSSYPVVAVEPLTENVFVAWYETAGVKVMRYDRRAGTWGPVKALETRGLPSKVAVGTDASGNIIVAWLQQYTGPDSSLFGVWVSQSSDGVAWSPAVQVASGNIFSLAFAMSRNGTARMAWTRETGTNKKGVFTAYYDKSSWKVDPTAVLDPNDPGVVDPYDPLPQLAVGGTGDGILVFDMNDASKRTSVGAVTLTGATRSVARILDTNTVDSLDSQDRSVAMNANGEGIVVWAENATTSAALNLATYKPSSGWTSVQKVASGDEFYSLGSALDNGGNITVAWVQKLTTSGHNVMAIHGKVGGTWDPVTPLETDDVATDNYTLFATPALAADAAGNVLAVWHKKIDDETYGAYARRLQGSTWQPQVKLGQKAKHRAFSPKVAVADSGFGAATFAFYYASTTDPDAYNAEVAFCR